MTMEMNNTNSNNRPLLKLTAGEIEKIFSWVSVGVRLTIQLLATSFGAQVA